MLQSSSSEKKLVKPLKNCFFGSNLHKKGSLWATLKMENLILGRNHKSRSLTFRNVLFYQNICFDWVMNLFLYHFQLKQQLVPLPWDFTSSTPSPPFLFLAVANTLVLVTEDMNIKVPVNLKLQPRRHNGTFIFTSIHLMYLMIHFYGKIEKNNSIWMVFSNLTFDLFIFYWYCNYKLDDGIPVAHL